MAFGEKTSAFFFHGHLHPAHHVPGFDVQEVEVAELVKLEVVGDGIAVWARPGVTHFKAPGEATGLFRLVAAAYALLARRAYDVSLDGWVEAVEAEVPGAMIGFMSQRGTNEVDPDSDSSRAMQEAVRIALAVQNKVHLRIALRDIHSAVKEDQSDDSFFFAYRAVESAARAVLGLEEGMDWAEFHRRMGREPEEGRAKLEPLNAARKAVAHGDASSSELGDARRKRAELIDLARALVAECLTAIAELGVPDVALIETPDGSSA